jgi:glycogen operon protein
MTDDEWAAPGVRTLGLRLAGDAISERDDQGRRVVDDTLLLVLNAADEQIAFRLPADPHHAWELLLDTTLERLPEGGQGPLHAAGVTYPLGERSCVLLRLHADSGS